MITSGRGPAVASALAVPLADLRAAAGAARPRRLRRRRPGLPRHHRLRREQHDPDRLYASLRDRQLRMGAANLLAADGQADAERMRTTIADHEAIAAAIGAADVQLAERLTSEHLAHADPALRGRDGMTPARPARPGPGSPVSRW